MSKDTQIKTGFLEKQAKENSKRGTSRGVMVFLLVSVVLALLFGAFKAYEMLAGFQTYQKIRNVSIVLKNPSVENGSAYVNVSIKNQNGYPVYNPTFKYDISAREGKMLLEGTLKIEGSVPTGDQRTFHHIKLGALTGEPAKLHSDLVDIETTKPENLPKGFNLKFAQALRADDKLSELSKLQEEAPDYAPLSVAIGIEQELASDWDGALSSYQKAIEQDNDLANAHYHLALVLLRNQNKEEGIQALEKAKQLSPNDPDISTMLESFNQPVTEEEN